MDVENRIRQYSGNTHDISKLIVSTLNNISLPGTGTGPDCFAARYVKNNKGVLIPHYQYAALSCPAVLYDFKYDPVNLFYLSISRRARWDKTGTESVKLSSGNIGIPRSADIIEIFSDINPPPVNSDYQENVFRIYFGEQAFNQFETHMMPKSKFKNKFQAEQR